MTEELIIKMIKGQLSVIKAAEDQMATTRSMLAFSRENIQSLLDILEGLDNE